MSNSQSKTTPSASTLEAARSTTPTAPATASTKETATSTVVNNKPTLPTPPTSLATTPTPPEGYTPTDGATRRRYRKLPSGQEAAVGTLATELKGSTTYDQDFGSLAPDQTTLVNLLLAVAMLEAALGPAELWAQYVDDERMVIVDASMTLISELATMFKTAVAKNATVAQKYPNLVAFLAARAKPSERARATKDKEAKKQAASAAAPTPAAAPAPAASGTGH